MTGPRLKPVLLLPPLRGSARSVVPAVTERPSGNVRVVAEALFRLPGDWSVRPDPSGNLMLVDREKHYRGWIDLATGIVHQYTPALQDEDETA